MSTSDFIQDLFFSYVTRMPLYAVWLIAGILALVRWTRHPRISFLILLALAIVFLGSIVMNFLWFPVNRFMNDQEWSIHTRIVFIRLLSVMSSLVEAVGWTLVLVAAFGPRREANLDDGPRFPPPGPAETGIRAQRP